MVLPIEYCSVPAWDPQGLKAPSVLVVDDDPALRKALTVFLKLQFIVFSAGSVDEAMEVLNETGADMVIMDYKMPGKDGLTGVREIREQHADVPILMLTAYADPGTFVKAMGLGASNCLKKPFELEDIFRSLGDLLEKGEEKEGDTPGPAGTGEDAAPWHRN